MNNINACIETFVARNSELLLSKDEWHISFIDIFANAFSEEDIRKELMANPIRYIDVCDGVRFSVIYMENWREICLMRIK